MQIDTKNAQRTDYISTYRKPLDVLLPTSRIGFYMQIDTKNAQRTDYISAYRKSLDVLLPTFLTRKVGYDNSDLTIKPAIANPAAPGTKAVLPGVRSEVFIGNSVE